MNSLSNYLNFDYGSFILPMIKNGRYRLITFDDHNVPIISTTFYIDGDALNEINMLDGQILAELHRNKLAAHLKKVELQVGSVNVLFKQIQAVVFVVFSIIPWLYYPLDHIYLKIGISGFLGLLVFLMRKWIPKVLVRVVAKYF